MNKKYYLYFFIVFESMQIIDLILTHFALMNPLIQELNPFYNEVWFISLKLLIPILITLCMYYINYFKIHEKMIMRLNLIIYSGIIINNIIMLSK
jgi:hypothetical protein